MKTNYIDLEEKEKKEKEELKTTHIPDVNQEELNTQDPTLASHKQGFPTIPQPTVPVKEPQPTVSDPGGNASITEGKSYDEYLNILNEGLKEPISTKEQQERLSRAAKITSTGEMLQNVIDLIAGGGSGGAPIFRRTDTATPAMLNQLERLRADEVRRGEMHNAQQLQNQIRAIQFGEQDENQERISRHFYEGQHLRKELQEDAQKYGAEQGALNREATVKAQQEQRKYNTEAQQKLEKARLKYAKELSDHTTANDLKEIEARYGANAALAALKAGLGKGGGDDTNFYVVDDETGKTVTIPQEQYWTIFQKVITDQNTYNDADQTHNAFFKLTDTQINALVAKHWKKHYTPPGDKTTIDPKTKEAFSTQAGELYDRIIADPNLKTVEQKRQRFGIYIDQMVKELGIAITPEQREAMLQKIQ